MRRKSIPLAVTGLLCTLWCLCMPWQVKANNVATTTPADTAQHHAVNVYEFDFEAVHPRTDEVWLPDRWERVTTKEDSPDFDLNHPFYNEARLVREMEDGKVKNHCLEMVLHKGKVSYQTKARTREVDGTEETPEELRFIPVNAAKSYRLSARIKAEGFEQADRPTRAYVSILWFEKADDTAICRYEDGTPIIFSTTAITRDTGGQWQEVGLTVGSVPPGAVFLELRCTLEGKGIKARAMFDDVALSEEPRVILDPGRPVPVFAGDEKIEIAFSLSGLVAGDYTERILTQDYNGTRVVQQDTRDFRAERDREVLRKYEVKAESFGTFRLCYTLTDAEGNQVAHRSLVLVRIPVNMPLKNSDQYGVCLDFLRHPYPVVGNFVHALSVGSVKSDLWGDEVALNEFLPFAKALRRMSITTVGVLGRSPGELTKALGLSVPLQGSALFSRPEGEKSDTLWRYLNDDLSKWTDVLEALQLGPEFDTLYTEPVDDIVAAFAEKMDRPLSSTALVFPAPASPGCPWPRGAGIVHVSVPARLTWHELAQRLSERPEEPALWVSLELPPQGPGQTDDMIAKIAVCLAANVDRIFLPLDAPGAGLLDVAEFPNESALLTPAFAAFRFTTQMTDGAESVDDISTAGVRMYLFEKDGESIVILWSNRGETSLPVYWGKGLKIYDTCGNEHDLPATNGETIITGLDDSPRIISRIDPRLLRTWRSVRLVTKSIESRVAEQAVEVGMENHFGKDIRGTVRLKFDEGLRHLQPRSTVSEFALTPGEAWSSGGAFILKPSISDTVGPKTVTAVVTIDSEDGKFTLRKTLEIPVVPAALSLKIIRMTAGRTNEIVVRVLVSNEGDSRVGANVYAAVEGIPSRRRVSVPRLEPGGQVEAEFRIHVNPDSPPSRIWLGLREVHGRRFTNIYIDRDEIKAVLK